MNGNPHNLRHSARVIRGGSCCVRLCRHGSQDTFEILLRLSFEGNDLRGSPSSECAYPVRDTTRNRYLSFSCRSLRVGWEVWEKALN